MTLDGLNVSDVLGNDVIRLTIATYFTVSSYQTSPVAIGGTNSKISISFTGGETVYDSMSFINPNNGLYATVIGANQIQFSLDTSDGASFAQDHLLVTLEDANDSSKKVTIDLNINTGSTDSIVKNN